MAEMEGGSAMNSISGGGSLGGSGSETTMMEASLPMDWEERRTKNKGEMLCCTATFLQTETVLYMMLE